MARKLVAIVLVLTLCLAFGSTAFAASRCPNCNGNYGIKSCSSSLGRSDTPNWVSCPITAACLYDIVSYWTAITATTRMTHILINLSIKSVLLRNIRLICAPIESDDLLCAFT